MDFKHYDDTVLETIIKHPREICKDPYKLLTSFLVNSILEMVEDEEEDGEPWGKTIPVKVLDRFILDCIEDFRQSFINDTSIRIHGEGFTVWKANTLHPDRLTSIVQFPKKGDEYVVCKEGIYNIKSDFLENFDRREQAYNDDRLYFRRIILMGYDDQHNGWDKLTDMECMVFIWATSIRKVPMSKHVNEEWVKEWCAENASDYGLSSKEVTQCFRENVEDNENLNTLHPFSMQKVMEWNKTNGQKSIVDSVSEKEANDMWFNILKDKFKRKI